MALFGKKKPESLDVMGRPFSCRACQNDKFWRRTAQLNTAVATFFNLDWANRSAACFVCSECGYVHWFLPP